MTPEPMKPEDVLRMARLIARDGVFSVSTAEAKALAQRVVELEAENEALAKRCIHLELYGSTNGGGAPRGPELNAEVKSP